MSEMDTIQFKKLRAHPTINQFAQTIEGKDLIMTGKIFALNGTAYHGFQGHVVTCDPRVMSDKEMDEMIDLDGKSAARVRSIRDDRLIARDIMKAQEEEERRKKKRRELRDELELRKLQAEERAAMDNGEPVESTEAAIERHEQAIAALRENAFKCDVCGQGFPSNNVLQGHIVGAHKPKRGKGK